MDFEQAVSKHFPGAVTIEKFVDHTYKILEHHGFNKNNGIACVSVCRDELTRPLVKAIEDKWGESFNCSSLAGLLLLGKTGFLAAKHHSPREYEKEHYIFFAMPHIAVSKDGEIGICHRPGRSKPSKACGALIAFRQEMVGGHLQLELTLDDIEQSILKQRLFRKIKYGDIPDLVTLTRLTHELIIDDLELMIDLTIESNENDYAILTGIQIHGPEAKNYLWPGKLYTIVSGQRYDITKPC